MGAVLPAHSLLRQGPLPHAFTRHDREPALNLDLVVLQQVPDHGCGLFRGGGHEPELDDSRGCLKAPAIDQLTEVTIEREENTTLVTGFLKHRGIGSARRVLSDRTDVQTVLAEQQDRGP